MKLLTNKQVNIVSGGDAGSTMLDICNDNSYPDSATITYTSTESGSFGLGDAVGTKATTTVSVSTTCGDLRGTSGSEGSGGNQAAGDGVGPGGTIIPFGG